MKYLIIAIILLLEIKMDPISFHLGVQNKSYIINTPLQLGTPASNLIFGFDTVLSNTWVATSQCTTCSPASVYSCAESSTCKLTEEYEEVKFNDALLQATWSTDIMSLGYQQSSINILGITKVEGDKSIGVHGMLGLGAQKYNDGKHLIKTLLDNKIIEEPIVGINMRDDKLVLGKYDLAFIGSKKFYWTNIAPGSEWYFDANVKFGKFTSSNDKVYIRTVQEYVTMPNSAFESFMNSINEESTCQDYICTATEKKYFTLPTIQLTFANHTKSMNIDCRYYTTVISTERFSTVKIVKFSLDIRPSDEWSIDYHVLEHFYVALDFANMSVGMIYLGMPNHLTIGMIIGYCIASVCIIAIITYASYSAVNCCKERERRFHNINITT